MLFRIHGLTARRSDQRFRPPAPSPNPPRVGECSITVFFTFPMEGQWAA